MAAVMLRYYYITLCACRRDPSVPFINLFFIGWSSRMAALLLCYHSTAQCTFKGDISASAICYFWSFIFCLLIYR